MGGGTRWLGDGAERPAPQCAAWAEGPKVAAAACRTPWQAAAAGRGCQASAKGTHLHVPRGRWSSAAAARTASRLPSPLALGLQQSTHKAKPPPSWLAGDPPAAGRRRPAVLAHPGKGGQPLGEQGRGATPSACHPVTQQARHAQHTAHHHGPNAPGMHVPTGQGRGRGTTPPAPRTGLPETGRRAPNHGE